MDLRNLRNLQSPTSNPDQNFTSTVFTHLLLQFILSLSTLNGPKHHANDSMLKVLNSLHHRDVSICVTWIRHLTRTAFYPPQVHISASRRLLSLHASHIPEGSRSPSRERIRNERAKDEGHVRHVPPKDSSSDRWELTVGIEIHAQLNTERKLFSGMHASLFHGIVSAK